MNNSVFEVNKIKNSPYYDLFAFYLRKVFECLSTKSKTDSEKTISKYQLLKYINLPFTLSQRLFKIFFHDKENINIEEFVEKMNILYASSLIDLSIIIFKFLDLNEDGYIEEEDFKTFLIFVNLNKNFHYDQLLELKNKYDLDSFIKYIQDENNNIPILFMRYIYENAPFNEYNLKMLNYTQRKCYSGTEINYIKSSNTVSSLPEIDMVRPTKKISTMIAINNNIDLDVDLLELEYIETEKLRIDTINVKFMKNMNTSIPSDFLSTKCKTSNTEYSKFDTKLFEFNISHEDNIYVYKSNKNVMKNYWVCLVNKDLFFYKDSSKNKLKHLKCLVDKFIGYEKKIMIDKGNNYVSFCIEHNNKRNTYYCLSEKETLIWINKIEKALNYKNFYDLYSIVKFIGEGSFCTVYLVIHKNSNKNYTMKKYKKANVSENILTSLMKDIDIMKICNSENILKFIDYFEDLEYIYIIVEYANRGNFEDYLGNNFVIKEKIIEDIIYQIARAISYLHSNYIIHRDINLKNILVYEENNKITMKLCNFSSSKLSNTCEVDCKKFSNVCFMPPEVFLNNIYNNKSDVWSLGIILYYLLFQKLPFQSDSDNYFEIYSKISNVEYACVNKISKLMDELLKGCLVKNYGERDSINDFLFKLKNV